MSSQFTIGQKLAASYAGLFALVLALGFGAIHSINVLGSSLQVAVKSSARKIDLANALGKRVHEVVATTRGAQVSMLSNDPGRAASYQQKCRAAINRIREQLTELRSLVITGDGNLALERVERGLEAWIPLADRYLELGQRREVAAAHQLMNEKGVPLIDEMDSAVTTLVKQQRELLLASSQEGAAITSSNLWWTWATILAAVAIAIGVFFTVRSINGALRQVTAELAQGADQLTNAAGQVSSASQVLAQGSSEQAASLEETSSSSEEIASMTRKNSENSRSAAEIASEAARQVAGANVSLAEMVESMNEINASSGKISKIIRVIDEIAFQTNILALNAAVEAARAGEAGMGFAVVADEVRNLAQRAAQAAKDTSSLIEESILTASNGKAKMGVVGEAISGITGGAEQARTLCEEVRLGSEEQTKGMEQIAKAIVQMQAVTQQTAASAQENASAGEELNAQSETLRGIVGRLSVMVGAQS
jgi:methyl-accepting chemotaxis protein/methyl-accepting chemotaxis protein-1 (serine sensor receptor)